MLTPGDPREPSPQPAELLGKAEWHDLVDDEFSAARENNTPLSVLFIDVNYFKDVNDTLGHDTGDLVIGGIHSLLGVIRDGLRHDNREFKADEKPDLVSLSQAEPITSSAGHIGGDEFGLLARTDAPGARKIMERVRNIFDMYIDQPGNEALKALEISLSTGAATLQADMESSGQLLHAADLAMYDDKLNNLRELTRTQRLMVHAAGLLLAGADVRVRDFPKYMKLMRKKKTA
jgi:GGDEF domain-containing protein